jgi:hypothetical protein
MNSEPYRSLNPTRLKTELIERLEGVLLGEKLNMAIWDQRNNEIIIAVNQKITKKLIRKLAEVDHDVDMDPSPVRIFVMRTFSGYWDALEKISAQSR